MNELITAFDQPVGLSSDDMNIFEDVDVIVSRAVTIGDPLIALDYGKELVKDMQVKGVALAKLLYRLKQNWNLFEVAGFEGTLTEVAELHLGRSEETVKKYIRMWESVFENNSIPQDVKNKLMGRPIGDLILLTAVAREGNGDELALLADASDRNSLRNLIRRVRGEQTSTKTAIHINLAMRSGQHPIGTLYAFQDGIKYMIGYLNVESDEDVVSRAIARIVGSARITEKY